jgi:alpha-beta hydrolase superfamily lysophospholipase
MEALEIKIDVSASLALPGPLHIAASVFLPDPAKLTSPPIVIFAFPGGGYSRGYFDVHIPGHHGYSQADHHAARGIVLVAADHLGVGASSIPDPTALSLEMLAAANDAAVGRIASQLAEGSLGSGFPPLPNLVRIGIGQSMGGCITLAMQGRLRTYAAIACLGFSAIHTVLPQRTEPARRKGMGAYKLFRNQDLRDLAAAPPDTSRIDFVYPFHFEDVPRDILDADMGGGYPIRQTAPPWGSVSIPLCASLMLSPGYIAQEAAAIDVPVLLAMGERDVVPDPHAEAAAFRNSPDVSICVVPGMAHMHNFAATRARLWDRIVAWSLTVAGAI